MSAVYGQRIRRVRESVGESIIRMQARFCPGSELTRREWSWSASLKMKPVNS